MARIRIDLDDLTTALSDHDDQWVLDLRTGQVLMDEWLRDPSLRKDMDLGEDEDLDELDDPLEWSERFRGIDSIPSHDGFRWMERFAASQDDERVRERLLDALDRPRPFRRFKDTLFEFPEVRDAWFRYEEARLREAAEAWLRAEGSDAELVDVRQSGRESETAST